MRVVAPANDPQCTVTPPTVAQQPPPTPTPKGHERRISSANLEAVSEVRQLLSRMTESEEYPTSDELEATLLHLLHVLSPERDGSDSLSANRCVLACRWRILPSQHGAVWILIVFGTLLVTFRSDTAVPSNYMCHSLMHAYRSHNHCFAFSLHCSPRNCMMLLCADGSFLCYLSAQCQHTQ